MIGTALITGASRGLGFALARFLALQGTELILTARGEEALQAAAKELSAYGRVTAIAGDVRDPAHRSRLAGASRGGLDLLINNASTLGPTPLRPLVETDPDELFHAFDTNAVAPLAVVAATLPGLAARGGLVVNVSSDAARGGYANWGAYGASKAALELIGTTLAAELTDVYVVTVDPGDMRTKMHQDAHPGEDISDRPLPEDMLPFWAWLLGTAPRDLNGRRLVATDEVWTMGSALEEMWVS